MLINQDIRNILPSRASGFDELERHYNHLQDRFYSRTISYTKQREPLGANCVNFLLSALVRSISLMDGLGTTINNHNILPSFLIVRAHYEVTGAIAYFLRELEKYKIGKCTQVELSTAVGRMTIGMKNQTNKADIRYSRFPTINNVLTYIDEADKYMKTIFKINEKSPLKTNYDFLSEFCHPNAFGLMVGRKIKGRVIEYDQAPQLSEKYLNTLLIHILPSSSLFIVLFDKAWEIVSDNFELPELGK